MHVQSMMQVDLKFNTMESAKRQHATAGEATPSSQILRQLAAHLRCGPPLSAPAPAAAPTVGSQIRTVRATRGARLRL